MFVDAVHDYVNAWFDGVTRGGEFGSGGLIAFHDTDNRRFAGVQRGCLANRRRRRSSPIRLFCHTPGVVVLERT